MLIGFPLHLDWVSNTPVVMEAWLLIFSWQHLVWYTTVAQLHALSFAGVTSCYAICHGVRILKTWISPSHSSSYSPFQLHMLLVDSHGDKIEAYVTAPNVKFFGNHLREGLTCDFACLGVEANDGFNRATRHACRLKITFTTVFEVVAAPIFPGSDFDFSSVDMVHSHGYDPNILRDVCGVLTGFTLERSCTVDGVTTKLALIELADEHHPILESQGLKASPTSEHELDNIGLIITWVDTLEPTECKFSKSTIVRVEPKKWHYGLLSCR
ncbi:hypothetical protein RIF29_11829 [Crotalaria pallida]|uniref:Replication protein A 70 kDa DNA-binding subunit B/D first OB fold domain-containing protein n=1 Tax=Crotalaria pallida TaxID=3830 RepID=A0AAN9IMI1_CROPI